MRQDETSSTADVRHARSSDTGVLLKAFLAAAAVGIAIGLALPAPHKAPPAKSQFATIQVGHG